MSLPSELIQNGQQLVAATIAVLVMQEVDGSDVFRMRRAQADDQTALVVGPPAFLLALRKPKPFLKS